MGLQRVVEDGLRAVLGLDDRVGLGKAALEVAALVAARLADAAAPRATASSGSSSGSRTSHSTSISVERGAGLRERVGGDRGDGARPGSRHSSRALDVARDEHGADARRLQRTRRVDRFSLACACGVRRKAACSIPGRRRRP